MLLPSNTSNANLINALVCTVLIISILQDVRRHSNGVIIRFKNNYSFIN